MLLLKHPALLCILALGLILCATNVIVTLQRTAFPRRINGHITSLDTLREKHPGLDDVLLLNIEKSPPTQIEYGFFNQLAIGDQIEKEPWTRSITINNAPSDIPWSPDFIGMAQLIPILILGLTLLAYRSARSNS